MASLATSSVTNNQPYGGSIAASIYDRAQSGLVNLANKYAKNEALSGIAVGKLADSYGTSLNTAAQIEYDNAFLGSMAKYQQGIENLRKGNTMELLAAETGAQKELMTVQGSEGRRGMVTAGEQDRLGVQARGVEDRLGVQTRGAEDRAGYRVQGDETRLTQNNASDNTIRLREHAKGSIREQGRRYYA
jgi:hypothetical protein